MPVPVDADRNGVLELIGSKVNQTNVFSANANICSGRIQAISFDSSNNAVPYTNFYANGVLKGTTDSNGLFETQASGICGQTTTYSPKCSNNTLTCGTQTKSIDFANDFDSLIFDCTICTGSSDLKIDPADVNISIENNEVAVNITSENVAANDVVLMLKAQDKDTGLISNESSVLFSVSPDDKSVAKTVSINLDNADFVHIYVDSDNTVNEPKTNNYAAIPIYLNTKNYFAVAIFPHFVCKGAGSRECRICYCKDDH